MSVQRRPISGGRSAAAEPRWPRTGRLWSLHFAADSPGSLAGLIDPVAQYDHGEGQAIVGGFVYRGSAIPGLNGKYVFGDYTFDETKPEGQLFAADLTTGQIERLKTNLGDPLPFYLKGLGQDANGELFALGGTGAGPSGTGFVLRIEAVGSGGSGGTGGQAVPLPAAAWAGLTALVGVAWLNRRVGRRAV